MRKLYFVSINGVDWVNMDTGDERKARIQATEMYPQGIYGAIHIGILEGEKIRRLLVRSTKVNDNRVHWRYCYAPSDEGVINRTRVFGRVYWLYIAGGEPVSERVMLLSNHMKAAKQAAARSPILAPGVRVEIFCQEKNQTEPKLAALGYCDDRTVIKWRRSVIENVVC